MAVREMVDVEIEPRMHLVRLEVQLLLDGVGLVQGGDVTLVLRVFAHELVARVQVVRVVALLLVLLHVHLLQAVLVDFEVGVDYAALRGLRPVLFGRVRAEAGVRDVLLLLRAGVHLLRTVVPAFLRSAHHGRRRDHAHA